MRVLAVMVCCLSAAPPADAWTVCLEKATGKVIQSQSHDDPGLCQKDLVERNPQYGYAVSDIEERIVTKSEHDALLQTWQGNPVNPDKAKRGARDQAQQQAKEKLKALGLTQEQVDAIVP